MSSIATIQSTNPEPFRERIDLRLPAQTRRKLERWRMIEDDAAALRRADIEQLAELRADLAKAQSDLKFLEAEKLRGKLYTVRRTAVPGKPGEYDIEKVPDNARLEAAQRRVQQAQDKIDRARERQASRPSVPLGRAETYLRSLPSGTALVPHEGAAAQRLPNESWLAAVERVRAAIVDLREQARSAELAPLPKQDIKLAIRREVQELAAQGVPGLLAVAERAGKVRWPTFPLQGVALAGGYIPYMQNAFALIAWLFEKDLLKAVERLVDEDYEDEGALSPAARAARLKEIAAGVLALEYEEESLIEQAEAEGIAIARRSDADPRALLGLDASLPAMRKS